MGVEALTVLMRVLPTGPGRGLAFRSFVYNYNTSERCPINPLGKLGMYQGDRGWWPMRKIRYQEIADELRSRAFAAPTGSVLPSESELSVEFGASRVTIRRALDLVREQGLIAARQGFGWYVAGEPVRQSLTQLGTIEAQLADSGMTNERRVIEFAF